MARKALTFRYEGDYCPKCNRFMIIEPPIPKEATRVVICLNCDYKAPIKEFADAFFKEFPNA